MSKAINNFALVFVSGQLAGHRFVVDRPLHAGRRSSNDIAIADMSLSSTHALFYLEDQKLYIRDLESTNGITVNGKELKHSELQDGDVVTMGEVTLRADVCPAETPPATLPAEQLEKMRKAAARHWLALASVLFVIAGLLVYFIFKKPQRSHTVQALGPGPLLPQATLKAAQSQLRADGVTLYVEEPIGFARVNEPVTSGVPFPEGGIKDVKQLSLLNAQGTAVPCQFTPMSHWPDGSLKWVLLDFHASVATNETLTYKLVNGKPLLPANPIKLTDSNGTLKLTNGSLELHITPDQSGLIHHLTIDDREIINSQNPLHATLINGDDTLYRSSKPTKVAVELAGPVRTTILVQGEFVDSNGCKIFDGKVGYDLRLTLYAGRQDLRLDFTLKNDGWYGYRNEGSKHPRQWLYFRELRLDWPIRYAPHRQLDLGGTNGVISTGTTVAQWMCYPPLRHKTLTQGHSFASEADLELALWPKWYPGYLKFYWSEKAADDTTPHHGALTNGFAAVGEGVNPVRMVLRRFIENFPAGASLSDQHLALLLLPLGGLWPRIMEAYEPTTTYLFEGGRRKTWEAMVSLGADDNRDALLAHLDHPLFARADPTWYRDTGAVIPMGFDQPEAAIASDLREAWQRYDRLQLAKVQQEAGDIADPFVFSNGQEWQLYEKVSIPSLWYDKRDKFMGWFSYGDLTWGFGYCSLHYLWPYIMHQNFLRSGTREFFDVGEDMIRHRQDIDQYHVENTAHHLAGCQRYEKGDHGDMLHQRERFGMRPMNGEINCSITHTRNRDLLLHWALTGDPRSLSVAAQNGRACKRFLENRKDWATTNCVVINEFRAQGWCIENFLALYEYTGESDWLDWANLTFEKTFLAMEAANGKKGYIIPNGEQSPQFLSFCVEPLCRLHHYTKRRDVLEFLQRVLDYQYARRCHGGHPVGERYYVTLWQNDDWELAPDKTASWSGIYSTGLLDGYAYLYLITRDSKYLALARRLFKEMYFYYGSQRPDVLPEYRTPLGLHYHGRSDTSHCEQTHAMLGRYGQLYLQIENMTKKPKR